MHPWCPFGHCLLPQKQFSNFPQCLFYHTYQWRLFQKYIKYKILLTLMFVMFFIYILVSSNIISNTFKLQHLGAPYCLKRKNSCSFSTTLLLFIVIFLFLVDFHVFCYFRYFIILGIVWICSYCWPNSIHSETKALHWFEFWLGTFKFRNIC